MLTPWPARSTGRFQDFKPDELKEGMVFYFEQSANLSGKAIYRAHIGQALEDKLVFDIETVSEMRYLFVALFHSREMQSIQFLDRESENICGAMARCGPDGMRAAWSRSLPPPADR